MIQNGIKGPHSEARAKIFARNNNVPLPVATDTTFILQLFNNELSIGYLGLSTDNYCILVTEASAALTLTLYTYEGVNYYMANGSYLTITANSYVCLEDWLGASGWSFESNGTFCCSSNNQHLSLYSDNDGSLYSYDQYTVLLVQQLSQPNQ